MTATAATRASIEASSAHLPLSDTADFADAERGFIARSEHRQIASFDSSGRIVWDLDAYRFLDAPCPDTAHPSLWRQGQLLIKDGLFEVVPGIYQVRGYDLSVISFIETDSGVVVVDPLISIETAAAAFALYREHRGERPVQAMIYTHSHADHFGGAGGIIRADEGVTVIAPEGFLEHAVSENIFAGTAMTRRAGYMYGSALQRSPEGQIGAGLGQTTSTGEVSLIPPTVSIGHTGEEVMIDGRRFVFQLTPGTEAPAELNFYLPQSRALCTAENTSHTLHNIVTLRGAQVRDARAWADYLTETIALFGDETDVVFASHHWPTWGHDRAVDFLSTQRDLYSYLHDQTLRMINQGFTGPEIAEQLSVPPALEAAWHTHGYYGSFSHNVKGVYQRYLGWYDGNPANLWQHPPQARAARYLGAMGGLAQALAVAAEAFEQGDYRWAAEVLNHILFVQPDHAEARELQAETFTQLAYGCENGTWRNVYLAGAHELRHGVFGTPVSAAGLVWGLTVEQVFSSMAVRVDGPAAWDRHVRIGWVFTDTEQSILMELRNGTLIFYPTESLPANITTFTLDRRTLIGLVVATVDLPKALGDGRVSVTGDPSDLAALMSVLAPVDPDFPIVTA